MEPKRWVQYPWGSNQGAVPNPRTEEIRINGYSMQRHKVLCVEVWVIGVLTLGSSDPYSLQWSCKEREFVEHISVPCSPPASDLLPVFLMTVTRWKGNLLIKSLSRSASCGTEQNLRGKVIYPAPHDGLIFMRITYHFSWLLFCCSLYTFPVKKKWAIFL